MDYPLEHILVENPVIFNLCKSGWDTVQGTGLHGISILKSSLGYLFSLVKVRNHWSDVEMRYMLRWIYSVEFFEIQKIWNTSWILEILEILVEILAEFLWNLGTLGEVRTLGSFCMGDRAHLVNSTNGTAFCVNYVGFWCGQLFVGLSSFIWKGVLSQMIH